MKAATVLHKRCKKSQRDHNFYGLERNGILLCIWQLQILLTRFYVSLDPQMVIKDYWKALCIKKTEGNDSVLSFQNKFVSLKEILEFIQFNLTLNSLNKKGRENSNALTNHKYWNALIFPGLSVYYEIFFGKRGRKSCVWKLGSPHTLKEYIKVCLAASTTSFFFSLSASKVVQKVHFRTAKTTL